jgi:hypothetical protein
MKESIGTTMMNNETMNHGEDSSIMVDLNTGNNTFYK